MLGSGDNGELTFIDIISIISFIVGLQNLDLNVTQNDFANATQKLNDKVNEQTEQILSEIHNHSQKQDEKINIILEILSNEDNKKDIGDD